MEFNPTGKEPGGIQLPPQGNVFLKWPHPLTGLCLLSFKTEPPGLFPLVIILENYSQYAADGFQ